MQIGPTIIYSCPACTGMIKQRSLLSGNTLGGRHWTDGKAFYPMLPDTGSLCQCPHCGTLIWADDLEEIGQINDAFGGDGRSVRTTSWRSMFHGGEPRIDVVTNDSADDEAPDFSSALPRQSPSRQDYLKFLESGVDDPERERTLRLRVWWEVNDARRDGGPATVMDEEAIANLERLAAMMDERDDDDRLMKAEILRELGRFTDAESLLAKGFPRRLQWAADGIRTRNAQRDTMVAEIDRPRYGVEDFSGASPLLFPPFQEIPNAGPGAPPPPRRSDPRMTLNVKQRQKIFKTLLHHRRNEYGPFDSFLHRFQDALLYVPLPPEAKDSKEEFKHRLDLLCRLFRQFYDSYSVRPQETFDGQWRQLHENAIIQLRDDISDGLIDLDRIDTEANAELFSSRGISQRGRILITTRAMTDPERSKYHRVVSHPAAHCIVWLTRRLQPHWEACGPYDDGSGYLTLIAEGASDCLRNTHDSDADPATKACDRRAWCCHVIDRLLGKLKGRV